MAIDSKEKTKSILAGAGCVSLSNSVLISSRYQVLVLEIMPVNKAYKSTDFVMITTAKNYKPLLAIAIRSTTIYVLKVTLSAIDLCEPKSLGIS